MKIITITVTLKKYQDDKIILDYYLILNELDYNSFGFKFPSFQEYYNSTIQRLIELLKVTSEHTHKVAMFDDFLLRDNSLLVKCCLTVNVQ